jgi:hypothetical protein
MAKRCMVLGGNGRIVFDYDMKIAEPFSQPGGEAGPDLWPAFAALDGRRYAAARRTVGYPQPGYPGEDGRAAVRWRRA